MEGRLTWETWPEGVGEDDGRSQKEGDEPTSKAKLSCHRGDGFAEEEDEDHDSPKQKRVRKEPSNQRL